MAIIFAKPDPFKIVRGTRWTDSFQLVDDATSVPIDLTGITDIVMRIRKSINSATILLELSITNTHLTLTDAATGLVSIDVLSAVTNTFPANNNKRAGYVTDAVIERSAGEYEPAISTKVVVYPSVSRPLDDA